jgi:hypothetical protein
MAKLTVFFKDKIIHSQVFESGIVHIGRDESNDLIIDSLAVAPAHAAIVVRNDGNATITQLNDGFPLVINGQKIKSGNLNNNDMIILGKHNLVYNTEELLIQDQPHESKKPPDQEIGFEVFMPAANLQILDGENIGRILSLKKAMTRLGHGGSGVIVITKRKEGYFVSVLENTGDITLNDEPLNDSALKLNHNDVLVVNKTSLQFFQR